MHTTPSQATMLACALLTLTHAQTTNAQQPLPLDTAVVHSSPLSSAHTQMTTPVEILSAEQLELAAQATIGDTIEQLPGVRGSSFGAGASRPVIRGMDGARVKVLSDGIDIMDASTISADHAVTSEPMLLRQIEVLKGPATLLYGGGAVGGVVNLLDRKIPTQLPQAGHEVELGWQGNSVANENNMMAGATLGLGQLALRVEGLKRNADPYRLAGREDGSNAKKQTGSYNDTNTANLGLSWINDNGYTGVAYSRQSNVYGLLAHEHGHCHTHGTGANLHWHCGDHGHGHDHDHDHGGTPYIDMLQKRWDLRSEYRDPFAGFSNIKLRLGHSDYEHAEIEGSEVSTSFDSTSTDARLELTHEPLFGWRGVVGLQGLRRNFAASGEEAYVPPSLTTSQALFMLEEYQHNNWRYELGLRHEWQAIKLKSTRTQRRHSGTSASVGSNWQLHPHYQLKSSLSLSQRLPVAEELYASGPHAASRTVEIGNEQLNRETSHNLDLGLHKTAGAVTFELSLFHNRINNYIYAADTGERPGAGYRVIEYRQNNAVLSGAETRINYHMEHGFTASLLADMVRGKLRDGKGNLHRMPADRVGVQLQKMFGDQLVGNLSLSRSMRQNRIAEHETSTAGYNMLSASLSYSGYLDDTRYLLFARADNLLNAKAREHTSLIKDQVQLPGRNLTIGTRLSF